MAYAAWVECCRMSGNEVVCCMKPQLKSTSTPLTTRTAGPLLSQQSCIGVVLVLIILVVVVIVLSFIVGARDNVWCDDDQTNDRRR